MDLEFGLGLSNISIWNMNFIISDIENAFSTGAYPKKLSYKLYLRKGLSLKVLKMKKDSDEAFVDAETLLGTSGLDQAKISEIKEIISEAKMKVYEKNESDKFFYKETEAITKVENPNVSIPELGCVYTDQELFVLGKICK